MIDKVQKIKNWISKEQDGLMDAQGNFEFPEHEGAYHILSNLDTYIDSLQEEPVSEELEKTIDTFLATYFGSEKEKQEWPFLKKMAIYFAKWQKQKDSIPISNELSEYINELSKQFPEVSFAKLSRIAVMVAKWQKEQFEKDCTDLCNGIATVKGVAVAMAYDKGMADTREQMMKNLWKPADGDELPEIDREVIALLDNDKVVFAHRPPEYWDGKNIITGKVTRNYPKTYDKGGWNIPNVKWWLDCSMPKEIEP